MSQDIFKWWYQISEKEPKFNEIKDWNENFDPLKDLDWNNIELKWGWIYKPFISPKEVQDYVEEQQKTPEEAEKISLEWYNPDEYAPKNDWISAEDVQKHVEEQQEQTSEEANKKAYEKYNDNNDLESTWLEPEISEIDLKVSENPNSPLIDSFVSLKLLSPEEWKKVKFALIEEGKDIDSKIMNIEWLDSDKKWQILDSINYLEKPEYKNECRKNFNKDFVNEIEDLKQDIPWEKEKSLSQKDQELIDKLWWNYFSVWSPNWKSETKKEALSKSFNLTLNSLMDWKSFKRPDDFENMKNIVKDPDLDFTTRFKELKKIDNLITKSQNAWIKKQGDAFWKMKKTIEIKNWELEAKFNDFKEQISKTLKTNDELKKQELVEEWNELKEEAKSNWEVFVVSELESLIQSITESKDNN